MRKSKSEDDGRLYPGHNFRDPGEPIDAAPYRPEARCIPEYALAVACLAERMDFGGPLSEADRARLAEMAVALAETSAGLSKWAQNREAEKAARIHREAKAPAPEKAKEQRACIQCEGTFLTDRQTRKFCSPPCGTKWRKRAARVECQPAGEAAHDPATPAPPNDFQRMGAPGFPGNTVMGAV
jgi:hypothetical protein